MVDNGSMQVSLSNSSGQYPDDPLATILERAIAEYHPAPTAMDLTRIHPGSPNLSS